MLRRPGIALLAALATAAVATLTWALALLVPAGRSVDVAALHGFIGLRRPSLLPFAHQFASLGDPGPFIVFGAALMAVAHLRGRPRLMAAVPLILLGASVSTQILKPLLADARVASFLGHAQIRDASWPSGHATAAMSLALCAVLVAPPRLRPAVAAAGAALAVAVSYSLLTLAWHYPSDVLGGFLVAATWTLLGVAALTAAARRWPERTGREAVGRRVQGWRETVTPAAVGIAGASVLAGLVVLARPVAVVAYAQAHTTFVVSALAIAGLGVALATGLALALRR